MNASADPCDDFYSFVCGGFMEKVVIPEGKDYWSNFGVAGEVRKLEAKEIMQAVDDFVPEDSKVRDLVKVSILFKICVVRDSHPRVLYINSKRVK